MNQSQGRLFIESEPWDVSYLTVQNEQVLPIQGHDHLSSLLSSLGQNSHGLEMIIIRQQHSWGRFCISRDSFKKIASNFQVFDQWRSFVNSFGLKLRPMDEDFGGYDRRSPSHKSPYCGNYEICYNIRYPELVMRPHEYPWVHRQLAVYQNCQPGSHRSRWILLQPSSPVEHEIREFLAQLLLPEKLDELDYQWLIHFAVLRLTECNWRKYINHLDQEVESLNDKSCFSRVGRPSVYDYTVTFNDSQMFQQTKERLLRARSSIEQTMETLNGLQEHFSQISGQGLLLDSNEIEIRLRVFHSRMRTYTRALDRLLSISESSSALLSNILSFRNDEAIQLNSAATNVTLARSEKLTRTLSLATEKTQLESRSMRVLTWVTIIYLPANLVASLFSTNLVRYSDDMGSAQSNQLGGYVGVTVGLLIVTIAFSLAFERGFGANFARHFVQQFRQTRLSS
ncbi:hypothetical protein F5Y16DRAFT_310848 [Xylariaceae sp. FL0255]|nr:hypothetical protein F5Y16DRAFT_310848 [Xylariaceae sp. FL0255]